MKDNVSGCAVEEAMRLLGGRWRIVLLSYLMAGPKRFSEIRRAVPNISQRMLTLDLRALERRACSRARSTRKCPSRSRTN